MHYITVPFLCVFVQIVVYQVEGTSLKNPKNSTETDSLDDRFNLNFNYGQATGQGHYGGVSQSNALSYGVNAAIRGPSGQVQNIYSNSGSQSNTYASGPGAPLTFANTGSRVGPGYGYGNANAGVLGGHGSSFATSQNQNIEIPLGQGTVLLSNLKERNSTQTNSTQANSTQASKSPEKANSTNTNKKGSDDGALVFA